MKIESRKAFNKDQMYFSVFDDKTSSQEWFQSLLSKDNLAAFKIQSHWKDQKINKKVTERKNSKNYNIKFYCSSLNTCILQEEAQERIQYIFDTLKLKYEQIDLNLPEMKKRIKEVEEFGGANKLPIVIINGYHIGGFDEIQDLVDEGRLMKVVQKTEKYYGIKKERESHLNNSQMRHGETRNIQDVFDMHLSQNSLQRKFRMTTIRE